MITEALNVIKDELRKIGVNYKFFRWQGTVKYPYFVGEISTDDFADENGYQSGTFFLNGFTRGEVFDLLEISEKIKQHFADFRCISESGSGISITFAASTVIAQDDAELKRIQITLSLKDWSVNNE